MWLDALLCEALRGLIPLRELDRGIVEQSARRHDSPYVRTAIAVDIIDRKPNKKSNVRMGGVARWRLERVQRGVGKGGKMPFGKRLIAYSAYLPHYYLPHNAIGAAIAGAPGGGGARAVAGYDEDAITLAVAAVRRLPHSRLNSKFLYFAATFPPFLDKANSSVVQAASGLSDNVLCVDIGGLRGGLAALRLAAETGGVVAMGDLRTGRPGSAAESESGDGAAAFLFGDDKNAVAEVVAISAQPREIMDVWRTPGIDYASSWEERFSTAVLRDVTSEAIGNAMRAAGMNVAPTTVLVSSPNARFSLGTSSGSSGGIDAHKAHRLRNGYCGAADVGLLLASALDVAKAGDTILVVSAVGGADAILVRALLDGPGARAGETLSEVSYFNYLSWRGFLEREPARRPDLPHLSAPATFRNQGWKFGLRGSRCTSCSTVYLPPQRVCGVCNGLDRMEPYEVLGRRAQIAAVSTDGVVDSPMPPAIIATVDIDGGGRINVELTDAANKGAPAVGGEVEFTFRRTYVSRAVPNYFWKARLLQGETRW